MAGWKNKKRKYGDKSICPHFFALKNRLFKIPLLCYKPQMHADVNNCYLRISAFICGYDSKLADK
jgi:hypothetical protein